MAGSTSTAPMNGPMAPAVRRKIAPSPRSKSARRGQVQPAAEHGPQLAGLCDRDPRALAREDRLTDEERGEAPDRRHDPGRNRDRDRFGRQHQPPSWHGRERGADHPTNVLKHEGPVPTHLTVRYGSSELEIEVTNQGTPSNVSQHASGGGDGLVGMRERVAMFGGRLDARSRPGGGFTVVARFPVGTATA